MRKLEDIMMDLLLDELLHLENGLMAHAYGSSTHKLNDQLEFMFSLLDYGKLIRVRIWNRYQMAIEKREKGDGGRYTSARNYFRALQLSGSYA